MQKSFSLTSIINKQQTENLLAAKKIIKTKSRGDYVQNNIRANNIKKLVSNNIKMKLVSNTEKK